jgi:hypothetical protein
MHHTENTPDAAANRGFTKCIDRKRLASAILAYLAARGRQTPDSGVTKRQIMAELLGIDDPSDGKTE